MSLSIAMPAMVNSTAQLGPLNASAERPPADSQDGWNGTLQQSEAMAPVYDWSPEIQGIILSSFNYASFLVPIPTGYIAGIFGAKYLVGVNLLLSSVLAFLTPLAADTGVLSITVLRIVQGIAQVTVLTSQFSIWVKWAPPLEKSQLINIAISGQLTGSFITLLIGGFLCQTKGWPSIFYIFGGIGCACSFLWFLLVYDDPINHRFISAGEKEYIVRSLAQQGCSPGWSLPIKAMIKSLPLWGILVFYFTQFWIFNILIAYLPTYINSVLQANLRDSGILSALLLGTACISTILEGLLADFFHSRKIFRLVTIRKLFTAIGVLVPSVVFVSLHWIRFSVSTSMGLLALSSVTTTFCQVGALVNILDIAPRYTSFLQGLSEVFAYSSGAISSTVAGFLISQDPEFGWRNVFLIAVSINISGLAFYLIFGQAKVQDWATEQMFTQL